MNHLYSIYTTICVITLYHLNLYTSNFLIRCFLNHEFSLRFIRDTTYINLEEEHSERMFNYNKLLWASHFFFRKPWSTYAIATYSLHLYDSCNFRRFKKYSLVKEKQTDRVAKIPFIRKKMHMHTCYTLCTVE